MKRIALSIIKWSTILLFIFAVVISLPYFLTTPKQNSNWVAEHAVLPKISIEKNNISVKNIRDFQWHTEKKEKYINM